MILSQGGQLLTASNHTLYNVTFGSYGTVYECSISGKLIFQAQGNYQSGYNSTVNEVEFQQDGTIGEPKPNQSPFFNIATFLGNGFLYGNNDFMTLNLAPRHSYQFYPTSNTKILPGGNLNASGPGCNDYITLISTTPGSVANLNTSGANLTVQYVAVMDIIVTGSGAVTAQNSIDLGNNSG